jgi:hypothetical protein
MGLNLTSLAPKMNGGGGNVIATKELFNHDRNRYVVTFREDFLVLFVFFQANGMPS